MSLFFIVPKFEGESVGLMKNILLFRELICFISAAFRKN